MYTYLRLTLNRPDVVLAYCRVLGKIQSFAVSAEAVEVSARAISMLKLLERAKQNIDINDDRAT